MHASRTKVLHFNGCDKFTSVIGPAPLNSSRQGACFRRQVRECHASVSALHREDCRSLSHRTV